MSSFLAALSCQPPSVPEIEQLYRSLMKFMAALTSHLEGQTDADLSSLIPETFLLHALLSFTPMGL